jgi:hypothetical protein
MASYHTYSDMINVSNFVSTELETASYGGKHEAKSVNAFFFTIKGNENIPSAEVCLYEYLYYEFHLKLSSCH